MHRLVIRAGLPITLVGVASVTVALLRRTSLGWGATVHETEMHLPGDDLLDRVDLASTRAITIESAVADVWPWIVQLGQARGGFYSYDFLENLLGCNMCSADKIVSEWQEQHVGAEVKLHPDVALMVSIVEDGTALVLRGGVPMAGVAAPYDFTWAFVLLDRGAGSTRLVVRERYQYSAWWAALVVEPVEFVSLVMSHRMLHGIRDRAERTAVGSGPSEDIILDRSSGLRAVA